MIAEKNGKTDVMQAIITFSYEMNYESESIPDAVMVAATKGFPFTAMAWIEAGGNVDATGLTADGEELTMLMIAACMGHLRMVDVLIQMGKASIDFSTGTDDACALLAAAAQGHTDIVLRLCRAGSTQVFRAIAQAERFGHLDTMSALFLHIKTVHASLWSGAGETLPYAVAGAAHHGLEATVLSWIEGGGCVDATYCDKDGKPLEDCVENMTLLHFACASNQASIVSLLIKHGADTNLQDSRGVSPLISCAARGHANIVSRL